MAQGATLPPLLALPIELRLQIYNHLFTGITLRANAFHYPLDDQGSQGRISLQPQSSLINTIVINKQIHHEALAKFYSLIRFRFERHSIDSTNWPLDAVLDAFPTYRPCHPSTPPPITSNSTPTSHNPSSKPIKLSTLVQTLYYAGNSPNLLRHTNLHTHFPSLHLLELDLSWDHIGNDQTNFDRAMKHAIRNREWRHAIKDALEQRFPEGMVGAVFELQKMGRKERGFEMRLHWRLAYRFVEFVGGCDLDEWVLRVWDPEKGGGGVGGSVGEGRVVGNVYEIRQDPMFYEMS